MIDHVYLEDLSRVLISPPGFAIPLAENVGGPGGGSFRETLFTDDADTKITDGQSPFDGPYRPEGLLNGFVFEEMRGTWKLKVTDEWADHVGNLLSWKLEITSCPLPTS